MASNAPDLAAPTSDAETDRRIAEAVELRDRNVRSLYLNSDAWAAWAERLADLIAALPEGIAPYGIYLDATSVESADGTACWPAADITVADLDERLRAVLSKADAVAAAHARAARRTAARADAAIRELREDA